MAEKKTRNRTRKGQSLPPHRNAPDGPEIDLAGLHDLAKSMQGVLDYLRGLYQEGHKFAAWDAMTFCDQNHMAWPSWVTAYLLETAKELFKDSTRPSIGDALGLESATGTKARKAYVDRRYKDDIRDHAGALYAQGLPSADVRAKLNEYSRRTWGRELDVKQDTLDDWSNRKKPHTWNRKD